ncbi:ImmA/IrrE family metallo-endopeptidase [Limimaricola sp.]|uniref:ImmA/IrrE family metallo-endopeptidase n=1 Tax=Limimaricola sp. TaxID=2211665 RepID=UPI004058D14F
MSKKDSFRAIVTRHLGPPVNIEGIVRALGIQLNKKAKLDESISGQLERLPSGDFAISANKSDHYYRQRFTIAHELGHYMLHSHLIEDGVDDNKAYRSDPTGNFYNESIGPKEETQANRFAAQILMPKSKILGAVKAGESIDKLAKDFQVSKRAMEIRLDSLGYKHNGQKIIEAPEVE